MAFLRPITKNTPQMTMEQRRKSQIKVNEGEQYVVAKKMFDSNNTILYFFYFNDYAEKNNTFYTYPITRNDI